MNKKKKDINKRKETVNKEKSGRKRIIGWSIFLIFITAFTIYLGVHYHKTGFLFENYDKSTSAYIISIDKIENKAQRMYKPTENLITGYYISYSFKVDTIEYYGRRFVRNLDDVLYVKRKSNSNQLRVYYYSDNPEDNYLAFK